MNNYKIYAVGIGPGAMDLITPRADKILKNADIIVGYKTYLDQLTKYIKNKTTISSGMTGEIERCTKALDETLNNKNVVVVSSGDAGVYGMAGLLFEMTQENPKYKNIEVITIPGITAGNAVGAILGAPLMNDYAIMSLSDLMTPKEVILKRLKCIAESDMVAILYNPRSKKRKELFAKSINIFKETRGNIVFGLVKNAERDKQEIRTGYIDDLPEEFVNMTTLVLFGSTSTILKDNKIYTPRGYGEKYGLE